MKLLLLTPPALAYAALTASIYTANASTSWRWGHFGLLNVGLAVPAYFILMLLLDEKS